MPWKTVKPMNLKMQLIVDWQTKIYSITDLSQKFSISRKTVYKWLNRFDREGVDGLKEQSNAAKNHPNQTRENLINMLIEQKLKNCKRGPKKVLAYLQEHYPNIKWPAASTIGEWFKKYGLVTKRKKRLKVPPYTEPFIECRTPNKVWSTDYKGQFHTRNGTICYPLTISDNYSRYLLACQGLPGPRYKETKAVFERVFQEYGLPDAIRSDNGTPFASRGIGALSQLSIWWIQVGIIPERIEKGCPYQNGRHERMHRTLKEEAINPAADTLKKQQKLFDWFCIDYNNYRPHESLGQKSPSTYYRRSSRPYMQKLRIPTYDFSFTVRKVRSSGDFRFKSGTFYVTELLQGQYVGLKEVADGYWTIYYSFQPLGTIDLRKNKIIK